MVELREALLSNRTSAEGHRVSVYGEWHVSQHDGNFKEAHLFSSSMNESMAFRMKEKTVSPASGVGRHQLG